MINKIANIFELPQGKPKFEFIVKRDGKVVYQRESYAGVLNTVEQVNKVNPDYSIEGVTQSFIFGERLLQIYAFDQLRMRFNKLITKDLPEILKAINYKNEAQG